MSWSYNPALPTTRDRVRFYIDDREPTAPLFSNEEIDAMLTIGIRPLAAAASLADALAVRYGRLVSQSIDGASFSYGERAKFYLELANRLRAQDMLGIVDGAAALGTVFISGVSRGDMASVDADTDRTPSSFTIGQHDDLGS
jgi:hypothetical protein